MVGYIASHLVHNCEILTVEEIEIDCVKNSNTNNDCCYETHGCEYIPNIHAQSPFKSRPLRQVIVTPPPNKEPPLIGRQNGEFFDGAEFHWIRGRSSGMRAHSRPITMGGRATPCSGPDVLRGTMDEVSSHVSLDLPTARSPKRWFRLIFGSDDGRAYVPIQWLRCRGWSESA